MFLLGSPDLGRYLSFCKCVVLSRGLPSAVAASGPAVDAEAIGPLFLAAAPCLTGVARLRAWEAGVGDAASRPGGRVIPVVVQGRGARAMARLSGQLVARVARTVVAAARRRRDATAPETVAAAPAGGGAIGTAPEPAARTAAAQAPENATVGREARADPRQAVPPPPVAAPVTP